MDRSVTEKMAAPTSYANMVPEDYLLASLAPVWRVRMKRAIDFLQETITRIPPPSWEEVAEESAVSPFHFHRMFRAVFQETPSQYIRRLRTRRVINHLLQENSSVIEVAMRFGFSSSQALAKNLRREVGMSASEIRAISNSEDSTLKDKLLLKLGHPKSQSDQCIEAELAKNIVFRVEHSPEIFASVEEIDQIWFDALDSFYQRKLKDKPEPALIIGKTSDLGKNYNAQTFWIGRHVNDNKQANLIVPAGTYLCCDVVINSISAYTAIWDALYNKLLEDGLEPDSNGFTIDIIQNPKDVLSNSPGQVHIRLKLDEKRSAVEGHKPTPIRKKTGSRAARII
ncbi:helix-turn-helix transcriptional regulator [Sansalvadorimonas sp. 2012CJ34-2]|uniref:Helix-turn-helix transcriptional regulator n=1 Tax=Parendozoicomonas callyspongiae TaxID=2942213 RepID=A0ABT0PKN7_9GAMM|nr:helix-turn-helix transcriptional regulator [Sansalvadorimonas sp. 2012CJ34-2]MCL6271952.1 helix-turn-helix transcriptional regulator [Sansalvadorimonas sp. 2012CJ34-2]